MVHDTMLRPWSAIGSIEHKPRNEEKAWTTVPSTMSGGFSGGSSQRVTVCVTTGQAEPRVHDERLFQRRMLVLGGATESPKRNLKCTDTSAVSVGVCSD